ncbi:MAG: hypothetical protein RSD19_02145, partial [Oscillospiraceae bacterium]
GFGGSPTFVDMKNSIVSNPFGVSWLRLQSTTILTFGMFKKDSSSLILFSNIGKDAWRMSEMASASLFASFKSSSY